LKKLNLGDLTSKIAENLQTKVHKEVSKYDKPVKLKVMSKKETK